MLAALILLSDQIMLFFSLVSAFLSSINQTAMVSINQALDTSLGVYGLRGVSNREILMRESLPALAEASKSHSILSSIYYDDLEKGAVELVKPMTQFTAPKLLRGVQVYGIHTPAWSVTAWVRLSDFVDGAYIFRKRVARKGESAGLSCFGWYMDLQNGPEFHYGGHDFFQTGPELYLHGTKISRPRQIQLGLTTPRRIQTDEFFLATLISNGTDVFFYKNDELLEQKRLPRAITDCQNSEGIVVGDSGIRLGGLRFYPGAFSLANVQEIFELGGLLSDISTGSNCAPLEEIPLTVNSSVVSEEVLSALLQSAREYSSSEYVSDSPAAPHGNIPVNANTYTDVNGRQYYSLINASGGVGPFRLTKSPPGQERFLQDFPSWSGTGMTLSFWWRWKDCRESCGLYFLYVEGLVGCSGRENKLLWNLWLETDGIYMKNGDPSANPTYFYPLNFMEDRYKWRGPKTWRHVTITFNNLDDKVYLYMDGVEAWSGAFGSDIGAADCSSKSVALGHATPGWTYGAELDVYDMRVYVHDTTETTATIKSLSEGLASLSQPAAITKASSLADGFSCIPANSELLVDSAWEDSFGHGCDWYAKFVSTYPDLCNLPEVSAKCRLTCTPAQQCFQQTRKTEIFYAWDRVRRIDAVGPNGTVCLSDAASKDKVVAECRDWVKNGGTGDMSVWLEDAFGTDQKLKRIDFRDCDQLEASIDEQCSFSHEQIQKFTAASNANGGDFTIAMWVRPVSVPSSSSKHTDGNFYPNLQFMSSMSPPQHNLAFGKWLNEKGEARLYSSCNTNTENYMTNIEVHRSNNDGWTFLAISRRSSTSPRFTFTQTNLKRFEEDDLYQLCLYEPTMFFRALEMNYPMTMSPLMLIPEALGVQDLQALMLQELPVMEYVDGPIMSDRTRLDKNIEVVKWDLPQKTVLMAPPVIVQERTKRDGECRNSWAQKFKDGMEARMLAIKCSPPFKCDDKVLQQQELSVYTCPGEKIKKGSNEKHFGLSLAEFQGKQVYADMLYSLTDYPFIFREGVLRRTEDFIDSGTERAQLIFLFYTPDTGVASVVRIIMDFSQEKVMVRPKIQHYLMLEGADLNQYLIIQVFMVLVLFAMVVECIFRAKSMLWPAEEEHDHYATFDFLMLFYDSLVVIMMPIYIGFRVFNAVHSKDATSELLDQVAAIPWDSPDATLLSKKMEFFDVVDKFLVLLTSDNLLSYLGFALLILNIIRLMMCMGCHPRLALLTGTLKKAADDIMHALVIVLTLIAAFALVAMWRFASEFPGFHTFGASFCTLFLLLLGELPENFGNTPELAIFLTFYILVLFFFVQNFVLAIIVEAYMQVRQDNQALQTEQSFFQDFVDSLTSFFLRFKHGWPNRGALADRLDEWHCKFSVGFRELKHITDKDDRASGLRWMKLPGRPNEGRDLTMKYPALAKGLRSTTSFTHQEWLAFEIHDLCVSDFIKSENSYFGLRESRNRPKLLFPKGSPSVLAFLRHYSKFCGETEPNFLNPPEIGLYGIEHSPDSEQYKMEQIKRAVHEAMGKKYPTLQDIVRMSIQDVAERGKKVKRGEHPAPHQLQLPDDSQFGFVVEKPQTQSQYMSDAFAQPSATQVQMARTEPAPVILQYQPPVAVGVFQQAPSIQTSGSEAYNIPSRPAPTPPARGQRFAHTQPQAGQDIYWPRTDTAATTRLKAELVMDVRNGIV